MTAQFIILAIFIGIAAGLLSGLVGIGGGLILVPALVYFMNETQHQAQGTSLGVLALPVTLFAFIQYYTECKRSGTPIDVKLIGLLAAGFIVGSYFGGSLAITINKEMLRKLFAVLLLFTAVKLLQWDVMLIRWIKNIF